MVTSTRPSSKWLEEKLASVPASKTVALIVDEAEVREQKLNCLSHLDSSKEFRQDLTLAKCVWIYTNDEAMRRILLIQYKATEAIDGASDEQKKMAQLLNMRTLACTVVAALQARKTNDVEVIASSAIDADSLSAFMTGFDLTNYEWSQRGEVKAEEKKETEKDVDERLSKKSKSIDNFTFSHENDLSQNAACVYNKITSDATKFARDLAQTRASHANPAWMEKQIRDLITAEKCEQVKEVRTLATKELLENGMKLLYAVGQSAEDEPRCVIVNYQGNPDSSDVDLALVGKGVTYDTGGLNLKLGANMFAMFGDKNGACAVLGALHGCLKLKPKKNIVFSVGLVENAIDSKSYKPGDIISSMKGLTVEIGNTDAEGRLVLCDQFTYVQKEFSPKQMIDLATLTGAVKVALGAETAGIFSNDDELAKSIIASGDRTFEPFWRLPITDEHRDNMRGKQSDLCNLGKTPFGGSCTAAAFLEFFVEKDTKWAHLDIAGPGMMGGPKPPLCEHGTGFGV